MTSTLLAEHRDLVDPTGELSAAETQTMDARVDANVGVLPITEDGKLSGLWMLDSMLGMLSMGARSVFRRPASVTADAVATVMLLAWRRIIDESPGSSASEDTVHVAVDPAAAAADAADGEMVDAGSHLLLQGTSVIDIGETSVGTSHMLAGEPQVVVAPGGVASDSPFAVRATTAATAHSERAHQHARGQMQSYRHGEVLNSEESMDESAAESEDEAHRGVCRGVLVCARPRRLSLFILSLALFLLFPLFP